MEVGPGLGSLTLAILETGADLTAVEIDPPLAQRLPQTIAEFTPNATNRFRVVNMDALKVTPSQLPQLADAATFTLVANLPTMWRRRFCSRCSNDSAISTPSS